MVEVELDAAYVDFRISSNLGFSLSFKMFLGGGFHSPDLGGAPFALEREKSDHSDEDCDDHYDGGQDDAAVGSLLPFFLAGGGTRLVTLPRSLKPNPVGVLEEAVARFGSEEGRWANRGRDICRRFLEEPFDGVEAEVKR